MATLAAAAAADGPRRDTSPRRQRGARPSPSPSPPRRNQSGGSAQAPYPRRLCALLLRPALALVLLLVALAQLRLSLRASLAASPLLPSTAAERAMAGTVHRQAMVTTGAEEWRVGSSAPRLRDVPSPKDGDSRSEWESEDEDEDADNAPPRRLDAVRQGRTRPTAIEHAPDDLATGTLSGPDGTRFLLKDHRNHMGAADYTELCRRTGLDSSSRLAVEGLLGQPPGVPLVLFLAKHCQVTTVLGVDLLFPNAVALRLARMQRDYRLLRRHVPGLELLVPPVAASPDDNSTLRRILAFAPTHIVSLATFPPDFEEVMRDRDGRYYEAYSALAATHRLATAARALARNAAGRAPRWLHVSSDDSSDSIGVQLSSVWLRTAGVPVTHLRLPALFGPLVAPLGDLDHRPADRRMYVDLAVRALLVALDSGAVHDATGNATAAHYTLLDAFLPVAPDQEALDDYYRNETQAWLDDWAVPELGTALNGAAYLDHYGLERLRFPCASRCASIRCTRTLFDAAARVSRGATAGCRVVLYWGNFSRELDRLPLPDVGADRSRLPFGSLCRVAYVSRHSRLVEAVLAHRRRQDDPRGDGASDTATNNTTATRESDKELLEALNGRRVGDWRVVWVDRDDASVTDLDWALLRMDPGAFFAQTVDRALYAESPTLLRGSDRQLELVFKQLWQARFRAHTAEQYASDGKTRGLVTVGESNRRRAMFYTRQSDIDIDYESFMARAGSSVPDGQRKFYEDVAAVVLSEDGRTHKERKSLRFDSFPHQWITPNFILHELSMPHSRIFRCDWMHEYLFWGGGDTDAALLSFAYTMGRRIAGGSLSPRMNSGSLSDRDGSWFAAYYPGSKKRMINRRKEEIFARIGLRTRLNHLL